MAGEKEPAAEAAQKMLFMNLVIMFSSSAMQQLGKLQNPMTGKTEVDLDGAQMSIDLLVMLRDKTKGNLDRQEQKLLADTIATLQLNYVDVSQTSPSEAKAPEEGATPEEGESASGGEAKVEGEKGPQKDPKFHKSYGG